MDLPMMENYILRSWDFSIFLKLDWDFYIASFIKTASKKIGALIGSDKFPS